MPTVSRYQWVSLYFHVLQQAHKSRLFLLAAQMICLLLFFSMALIPIMLQQMLFARKNSSIISISFFILVLILDVYSLFFLRTRTSLKFFPIMIFLMIYGFLLYLNCNPYSFDFLALCALYSILMFLMSLFVICIEYPACKSWDVLNIHTPKLRVPRMLFNPVFNTTWMHDSPQMWSIFMPLFGRGYFDRRHLAYINNDLQALSVYRNGNVNGENNLFSFEERHLINMPGFMDDDVRYRV